MGSLGDKFKKLAGDQTRQLLQNFQNAQSSKTRNGYSYGKLNEDGTATLADGSTVQVEVKGRPGQYAPVFNLGNGQGLVDQPEAKFFNIDSSPGFPYVVMVTYLVTNLPHPEGLNPGDTLPLQRLTINDIFLVNKDGIKYSLPSQFWPFSEKTIANIGGTSNLKVTISAAFGGFSFAIYESTNQAFSRVVGEVGVPTFEPITVTIIHSFSLQTLEDGSKVISVKEDDFEIALFDVNPYMETLSIQFSNEVTQVGIVRGEGEPCYFNGTFEQYAGNSTFSILYSSAFFQRYLKLLIRGKENGKLILDLSLVGRGDFSQRNDTYYDNMTFSSSYVFPGPPGGGSYGVVMSYYLTANGPYATENYTYRYPGPQTGDGVIVTLVPGGFQAPYNYNVSIPYLGGPLCVDTWLEGGQQRNDGAVSYSRVIKNFLTAPEVVFSDIVRTRLNQRTLVQFALSLIPSNDKDSYHSIFTTFAGFAFGETGTTTLNRGYTDILYSTDTPIVFASRLFLYSAQGFPIGVLDDEPIIFGSPPFLESSIFGGVSLHRQNKVDLGIEGFTRITDFQNYFTVSQRTNASLFLTTVSKSEDGFSIQKTYTLPSLLELVGNPDALVTLDYDFS